MPPFNYECHLPPQPPSPGLSTHTNTERRTEERGNAGEPRTTLQRTQGHPERRHKENRAVWEWWHTAVYMSKTRYKQKKLAEARSVYYITTRWLVTQASQAKRLKITNKVHIKLHFWPCFFIYMKESVKMHQQSCTTFLRFFIDQSLSMKRKWLGQLKTNQSKTTSL